MLPAFAALLLWALSATTARQSIKGLGPELANVLRLGLALSILAVLAHTLGFGWAGAGFGWFLLSGLVGFGIGDVAGFQSLHRLGARLSVLLMQCGAVPVGMLGEWLLLNNPPSLAQIGLAVVVAGGLVVALAPREGPLVPPRALLLGIAFGLVGALGQGLGAVFSRLANNAAAAVGDPSTGIVMGLTATYQRVLGGMSIVLPVALWVLWQKYRHEGRLTPANGERPPFGPRWAWVVVNGLSGAVLGAICYQWALSEAPSYVVLPIVSLTPIAVIPLAWALEGDRPTLRSLVGGLIAVGAGIALALT